MRRLLGIARTGASAVLLHPLRSGVTVACVVAVVLPYVAGVGISRGLLAQANDSIRFGADLYVSGRRLGNEVPVPLAAVEAIRAIPGVTDVVPRIVGEIRLGRDDVSAVLVGLPSERLPSSTSLVDGRLFAPGARNEVVVGSQLARRLRLRVGSKIPPFYRSEEGERVSTVVGVFRSDLPVWEANLVFASFETAASVFDQKGLASSLLVSARPEYREDVRTAILRIPSLEPGAETGPLRPRVTTREDLSALLPRGLLHREGVFNLHFLLAFAVGIPVVLVTTGVGLVERRREAGLLKATGWQTDEVLVRALVESVLLGVAGAAIAVLLAFLWLGVGNGWGVAGVFVAGLDVAPGARVPFRLTPVPVLLAFVASLVVVTTGAILSSWRAASAAPAEAMR